MTIWGGLLVRRETELTRMRGEMESVLWEVLSQTNCTKAQFSNMMNFIMTRLARVRDQGFPRIALAEKETKIEIVFDGHSVFVPRTEDGLKIVYEVLRHREPNNSTIGMKGEPTQWHVDKMVAEFKAKRAAEPKPVPDVEVDLGDLGI